MSEQRPRKVIGSYWRKTNNEQSKQKPRKPVGSDFKQSEPPPHLPNEQQASPPSRERQSETQEQKAIQEPDRYQPPAGYSRLGRDIHTGAYIDVPQASRRQGLYILGIQGTGKTGLIENLIIQDIKQGMGVGLLDPHGDVTQAVLSRVPEYREQDVIFLDITDYHYPFGLNLFACSDLTSPIEVQKTVDQVRHIFEKLLRVSSETPLILDYLKNCTRTLIANPGYTMADIPLLLQDGEWRRKLVANVTDRDVQRFWQLHEQKKPADQIYEISSILRRVDEFLQPVSRPIVGQSASTINIRQVMDERKILLVKLSTELPYVTSLIGSILIALFLNAAYSRSNLPVSKRKQFNLYADEFQRFSTEDFATLLEEARKYGIATTIAHQNRSQLDSKNDQLATTLKDRSRSAGNLVVFKVNSKDAEDLAGELAHEPDAARIEVQKPQEHRRVEEQIEIEVEEEIQAISTSPVDFLVSVRGTHRSPQVRRATQEILVPLVLAADGKGDVVRGYHNEIIGVRSPYVNRDVVKKISQNYHYVNTPACSLFSLNEGKNLLNALLVDVMEGRIRLRSGEFAGRIETIVVRLAGFIGWYPFPEFQSRYPYSPTYERQIEMGLQYHHALFHAASSLIRGYAALGYQPQSHEMEKYKQEFQSQLCEMLQKRGYNGSNGQYESEMKALALRVEVSFETFVQHILALCKEVATEEGKIKVPTGQKRMVKRIQPHITYLTDESEKLTHPKRTYEDMKKQVAAELTDLDDYRARVRIKNAQGKRVEHTVRTLIPEEGLHGQALQERLDSIKEQNIQDGYVRELAAVEQELRARQAHYSEPPQESREEPPEEEPPVSRRQRPHR